MNISELDKKIVTISALIGTEKYVPGHFVTRSGYFFEKGRFSLALEDAKAAMRLDPKYLPAFTAAGRATLKMKRFDESYNFFKEGLKIDPKSQDIVDGLKELQDLIIAEHDKADTTEGSYNAVELCSQDIYPGDDELYRLEQEILAKKYKVITAVQTKQKTATLTNQKEANKEAIIGHQCFMMGRKEDALYHCNTALSKDEMNNSARYLRAQINIAAKDMSSALQDLALIPKSRRTADIWKMGGKVVW